MERAVLGNIYIGKLLEYRDVSNSACVGSGISAEEQMRLTLENEILNGRNDGNGILSSFSSLFKFLF